MDMPFHNTPQAYLIPTFSKTAWLRNTQKTVFCMNPFIHFFDNTGFINKILIIPEHLKILICHICIETYCHLFARLSYRLFIYLLAAIITQNIWIWHLLFKQRFSFLTVMLPRLLRTRTIIVL